MIKVVAITSGRDVPSARFRVRQYIAPLLEKGIRVRERMPAIEKYAPPPPFLAFSGRSGRVLGRTIWMCAKVLTRVPGTVGSWKGGITWLQREMHPGLLTLEPLLKHPLVFDVDDAVWLTPPFGRPAMRTIGRMADLVLAGNSYIAEWFGRYARDVRIVPTAVDTERIRPRESSHDRFVIGWTGTSSNFPSLYRIEKALGEFLKNHDAELLVVADQAPEFSPK